MIKNTLGSHFRKNRNMSFEALTNKTKSEISSWQIPMLSQVGRNTLIKSAASAIYIYNMFALLLPYKTTDSIDKLLRAFWCESEGKRKSNTIKWDELSKLISEGDLGVRDTKSNNLALVAETCWRCLRVMRTFSA